MNTSFIPGATASLFFNEGHFLISGRLPIKGKYISY